MGVEHFYLYDNDSADEPETLLAPYVAAGLVCLVCFRLCVMALTSLGGSLLVNYAGLMFLNYQGFMDAAVWCEEGAVLLNWTCGVLAVTGFAFQFLLDRWLSRRARQRTAR